MPLDPSIFQNAGPKPIDIGSLIEMARGKQRLDAESSMGDIFAGAANDDGSIDTGKLATATNLRRAGPYAANLAQQSQALQQGGNIIDGQKMENARTFMKVIDAKLFPLLSEPDETLHGKIQDAIHDLIGHENSALKGGMFTAQMGLEQAARFQGKSPHQQRTMIGQMHGAVLDALQASEVIHNGVFPQGHPLAGNPMSITRGGAVVQNAQATGGPGAAPPPQGGAYREPGARAPAAAAGAQYGAPGVPRGAMQGEPAAGFEQAAHAGGTQLGAERIANSNYRREVTPLEQAIPALSRLDKYGTGPGTDEVNKIKSFLQSAGVGGLLGIDPEKIKNFDEAKKYMVDWIMASGTSGAGGRNADALAAAFSSNPNVGISKAANADIAKVALSLRRMKYAQQAEFERTGLPEGQYGKWASTWNAKQDPRAFGFDLMTGEAAKKFLKGLSPQDRARFDRSLGIAEHHELTSPRGGWNAE